MGDPIRAFPGERVEQGSGRLDVLFLQPLQPLLDKDQPVLFAQETAQLVALFSQRQIPVRPLAEVSMHESKHLSVLFEIIHNNKIEILVIC